VKRVSGFSGVSSGSVRLSDTDSNAHGQSECLQVPENDFEKMSLLSDVERERIHLLVAIADLEYVSTKVKGTELEVIVREQLNKCRNLLSELEEKFRDLRSRNATGIH
jgi:hypothetical protein